MLRHHAASPPCRRCGCHRRAAAHQLCRTAGFATTLGRAGASAARESAESIGAALQAGGGFGVERDGALLAVVLWQPTPEGLYLGRLAVAAAARRQGLALQLIAAVEAEARRRGAACLHLKVRLPLLDNRRLFQACGFHETERFAHEGFAEPTYCAMVKPLTPHPG